MRLKQYIKVFLTTFFCSLVFAKNVSAASIGPVSPFSFYAVGGNTIGTVKLTWYDDGSAKQYNLLYGTSENELTFGLIDLVHTPNKTNEFTVEYLNPGQNYYFKLYGVKGDGTDAVSGPIIAKAAKTNKTTGIYLEPTIEAGLNLPCNLKITSGETSGSVNIYWTDSDGADKYDLVYGTKPGEYLYGVQNIPFFNQLPNKYTVYGLSPGTTYYFALVAERNNNVILWSDPLRIISP